MRLLKSWKTLASGIYAELFGGLITNGPSLFNKPTWDVPAVSITQAATLAVDLSLGQVFKVSLTTNAAFVWANPTNAPTANGGFITLWVANNSGGAHGAGTFDTLYKTSGNWPATATAKQRMISFWWDGTNYVEVFRGAADVAV